MSVGTSALRGLKTSVQCPVQCPGYLLLVGWGMPDFRLQFRSEM